MDGDSKASSSGLEFRLHPLVMVNVSDHHMRVSANRGRTQAEERVVGCLLGSQDGRVVEVTNSFQLKYSCDSAGSPVIDKPFLVQQKEAYATVFPNQDVVGWYATGASISPMDMKINKLVMEELIESPVYLLLDAEEKPGRKELPITLYETELHIKDGVPEHIFVQASYSVETSTAERIGVNQMTKILPTGKAKGNDQLSAHLMGVHSATKMLKERVGMIQAVLRGMQEGRIPFDRSLLIKVSAMVHQMPILDSATFQENFLAEYNDAMLTTYLAIITKGNYLLHEVVDKFGLAYDKPARRSRAMPL